MEVNIENTRLICIGEDNQDLSCHEHVYLNSEKVLPTPQTKVYQNTLQYSIRKKTEGSFIIELECVNQFRKKMKGNKH